MSFGQIMRSVFGHGDVLGRQKTEYPTPKQEFDTAFERFNKSINDKNSTQKLLKKSVVEWTESSASVNDFVNDVITKDMP